LGEQDDLEAIIASRIQQRLESKLLAAVKKTVNGLQTQVNGLTDEFNAFRRKLEARMLQTDPLVTALDSLRLSAQDVLDLRDLLDDRKANVKRQKFYQTWLGQASIIAGILFGAIIALTTLYTAFFGAAHPLRP
jgi:uncharacterized protein YoxC